MDAKHKCTKFQFNQSGNLFGDKILTHIHTRMRKFLLVQTLIRTIYLFIYSTKNKNLKKSFELIDRKKNTSYILTRHIRVNLISPVLVNTCPFV